MIPSRRDFLQTSGWLLVSVGAAAVAGPFDEPASAHAGLPGQSAGGATAGPYPEARKSGV